MTTQYQLTNENFIIRIDDGVQTNIPLVMVQSEEGPPTYIQAAQDYFDWVAAGGTPLPADSPNAITLIVSLRQSLSEEYDTRMQIIAAGYPTSERESWPVQTQEARAILADNAATTPWIDAAAQARGIDRIELATRICAKDDNYRRIHGALTGTRQRIEDLIDAAESDQQLLKAIDVTAGWPDLSTL